MLIAVHISTVLRVIVLKLLNMYLEGKCVNMNS